MGSDSRLPKILIFGLLLTAGAVRAETPPVPAGATPPPVASKPFDPFDPAAEIIYHILVAETALRRTMTEVAVEHYRIAARASTDPAVAERAANVALYGDQDTALLEMSQRWQALAPGDAKARQAVALALLRNGKVEEAIPQLEAIRLAAGDDKHDGFATVTLLLSRLESKETPLQVMERLRALHPNTAFVLYHYALAARNANQPDKVREALDTAVKLDPTWAPAHLLRTQVMIDQGDTDAALQSLDAALAALPDNRELRIGFGRLLINAERVADAARQFQILAEQDPKDPEILFTLGVLSIENKQLDAAAANLQQVVKLGGNRLQDSYFELGRTEELRKNYQAARDWYVRVESEDRYLTAQVRAGAMLAKLGDFPGMSAHFAGLRSKNPESAIVIYVSESEVLREENRYQDAFDLLSRALELHPGDDDLLYSRALLAERLNRLDLLEQDLRTVIAADPKNAHAFNALGYTLADRTDRYQEALGYLEQAIALLPDDPAVVDSMGWVNFRLGRTDQALEYLRRAYELSADDEIAAHLVEVLWVAGQREEARQLWQKALEKKPDSEYLLKLKTRLEL